MAAERSRRYERTFRERRGVTAAARKVQSRFGDQVRHGPFAGMRLLDDWPTRNAPVLNLLGAYEAELHPILEEAIGMRPRLIANVGCADGYYAVGLAGRVPRARVLAYDGSRDARRSTRALAERNNVADRVSVRGRIRRVPEAVDFMVCDVEGAEGRLLTDAAAQRLARAIVIVEAHEGAAPGVGELLCRRFAATHHAETISEMPVLAGTFEEVAELTREEREAVMSEHRPGRVDWLVFRPRMLRST